VRWAFTTTFIEHHQPLAWLAWSAVKTSFGLSGEAFHGVSLLEARYTYNLALTLQREGRVADAALAFRHTLELDPQFTAAREGLRDTGR
jgi:hypothetical protein